MAVPVRRADPSVTEILLRSAADFEFFQAVRLVGRMFPGKILISGLGDRLDEVARFRARLSLEFPASQVYSIEQDGAGNGPLQMTVNFMGLTGPQGVLPSTYTEYLIARTYSRDTAAVAFLDIFNHRLIALFYLAWEKHHFPVSYERESLSPKPEKRFTQYLFDLIGMGTQGLRERLEVEDEGLLLYAGLIAQRPHSAIALEGILRDYFQAPAAIEQFCGRWFPLEQDALCYLDSEGLHNQLGFGAVAGDLVWNQQAAFRVRLGPLAFERFNELLPGGAGFRRLVSIVRYFVNGSLDFDVQLVLAANEVPAFRLEDTPGSPRLGWSSWLKTVEFTADAGDAILPPSAAEKVTIAVAANASRAAL